MMRRAALLSVLYLLAFPALAGDPVDYKKPDRNWAKGPVRWIMSEEEEKEFKKLRTDEERGAFVKAFWEKRDPTPGTPENEFELLFWKKVEQADESFKSQTTQGCLTDRGRVFTLLGGPTKQSTDARGRLVWTFEPNESTGIRTRLDLVFAQGSLSPLLLDRKVLEEYLAAHPEPRGIGWKIPPPPPLAEAAAAPGASTTPAAEDLSPEGKRQQPILEALLSKGSGPTDVPFQVSYDYYAAVDGTTLTVLTIEAPREAAHGSGDVALLPFARLDPAGGNGKPVNLTGDLAFVPASSGDAPAASFVYQARRNLAPGSYRVCVVVEDKVVAGQMGTRIETIDVPDFRNGSFNLSSIALLSKFSQIESGLGPDEKDQGAGPYVLGSFRLVPRPNPTLQKDEALSFYYQIYKPSLDPSTGRPSLSVTYTFFLKDGSGWKPFRKPIVRNQRGQVELYSIAMKDFLIPDQKLPAEFRMEVRVADGLAGKELKREVAFVVR
jgi:GWxTD domain-containing protein